MMKRSIPPSLRCAVLTAAVFSGDVSLYAGGVRLDPAKLSDIRISYASDSGTLFSGFTEGEMSFSYYGELSPPPDAEISLTVSRGAAYISVTGFRISSIRRSGRRVSIKARDRMRMLEKPLDTSGYEEDQRIPSAQAVEAAARACGFSGTANVPSVSLCLSDLRGRTARQLLRDLSAAFCGVWVCTSGNVLAFMPFGTISSSVSCPADIPFYIHSTKGPITRLEVENTETHAQYIHGTGDYTSSVRMRGRMITRDLSASVMSRIAQKYIRAFSAYSVPLTAMPFGVSGIIRGNTEYAALRYTVHIGSRIYADMEYPDICENEFDHITKEEYALRERMDQGTAYGAAVVTEKGLGILSSTQTEDIRDRDVYFFEAAKGAVARFGGAVMDGRMPASITDLGDNTKRIAYDGVSYILSYSRDGSQITDISFEEESEGDA